MPQQQAINEIFEFQTEEARQSFIADLKTHFPSATWATARNGKDADGSFICAVTQEAIDAETE